MSEHDYSTEYRDSHLHTVAGCCWKAILNRMHYCTVQIAIQLWKYEMKQTPIFPAFSKLANLSVHNSGQPPISTHGYCPNRYWLGKVNLLLRSLRECLIWATIFPTSALRCFRPVRGSINIKHALYYLWWVNSWPTRTIDYLELEPRLHRWKSERFGAYSVTYLP